jgi:hypothetical protein
VTNPGTRSNAVGDSVSLSLSASGLPSGDSWTYGATGLPSGLSISSTTGVISGTITGAARTYSATVTASDGHGGSASQVFTWNVSALSLTNPGTQTAAVGARVSLQIVASGLPAGDTWAFSVTDLPTGLTINPTTGLISGTATGAIKTYSVTVTATDGDGAKASVTFNLKIT